MNEKQPRQVFDGTLEGLERFQNHGPEAILQAENIHYEITRCISLLTEAQEKITLLTQWLNEHSDDRRSLDYTAHVDALNVYSDAVNRIKENIDEYFAAAAELPSTSLLVDEHPTVQ